MTDTLTHTTDVLTQTEARTAAWFKGRLAETCDRTRDGIFTVLNVASSLCESKHAAGAIAWERSAR